MPRSPPGNRGRRTASTPAPSSTWIDVPWRSSARTAPARDITSASLTTRSWPCWCSSRLLPATPASAFDEIQRALTEPALDGALVRFCRLLDAAGVLEDTELALAGDAQRAADFLAVREAVPSGVNRRIRQAKQTIDARIEKTAGDMIVPFDRSGEMMDVYRRGFESRGLDYAIWGHLSDGNVHPNVLAQSYEDVVKGKEAMLEFGRHVSRLGGCALAEHGVGRNPVKHALLEQLYGGVGIDEMRAVKQALDPMNRLAPGVIFPRRA